VRALVVDALRYWAAIGIDGFRFDLAVALARENGQFRPVAALLTAIARDPLLSGRKLIVEPWDAGPDGHQLGRFPTPFVEWNDRFRDTVRRFWRGDRGQAADLATRLAASSDVLGERGPLAGINRGPCCAGISLASETQSDRDQERRLDDCRRLGEALASAGFPLPAPADGMQHASSVLIEGTHRFLASSAARLFLAHPDDLLGEVDQINVPGTVDTYPNWRRKLSIALEAPAFAEAVVRLARICRDPVPRTATRAAGLDCDLPHLRVADRLGFPDSGSVFSD
jgi:hypothetical protein